MYRPLPHITNTKMQKGELCMEKTTIIRTSNAPIIFRSKFQSQFDELPKHWQNQLVDIFSSLSTIPMTFTQQMFFFC